MKKAFTVYLFKDDGGDISADSYGQLSTDEMEGAIDDDSLWSPLEPADQQSVDATVSRYSRHQRLQCYCHTLQLAVGDGVKQLKCLRPALAETCRLRSVLHSSTNFKDKFEAKFGTKRGIPAAFVTRWNSTFHQIRSLISLDYVALSEVCEDTKEKQPSEREWNQLTEFVEVMLPFAEATDLLQGDKVVTISAVVPSILSINNHLQKLQSKTDRYLMSLVKELQKSLQLRFSGVFINIGMQEPPRVFQAAPFDDEVYLVAALLDPTFAMMWVDNDVLNENEKTAALKRSLKGT